MILVEVNENLLFGGISITDWIQAFGALIAVIAAILGFVHLSRRNDESERQINSLTTLAKQSEVQSEIFTAQVDQMIEGNKLQTEYLEILQKSLLINQKDSKINEEQRLLDEKRRKFEIRPKIVYTGAGGGPHAMNYNFKNMGGIAKIIKIEKMEGNNCIIKYDKLIGRELQKNARFDIAFESPAGMHLSNCKVNFKLTISDIENNKYDQTIEGNPRGKIKVIEPIEIKN